MRALAHPLRWALLEALAQAGTLTATQASEMLTESPANCAFHLRTLAKYGFVEEAGGGRGRERPWRRTYDTLSWGRSPDDPGSTIAAEALDQVWIDRLLTRARRSLTSTASWPQGLGDALGTSSSRLYVRPAEARRLYAMISEAFIQLAADPRSPTAVTRTTAPRTPSQLSSSCSDTPSSTPRRSRETATRTMMKPGRLTSGRRRSGRPWTAAGMPGHSSERPGNVRPPRHNGQSQITAGARQAPVSQLLPAVLVAVNPSQSYLQNSRYILTIT